MNIPQITSIDTALGIYYKNTEIGNKEIKALFGNLSSATVCKLKKAVKTEMNKRDAMSYCANRINTVIAFETWHIDVVDLEKRRNKLSKLGLEYISSK